MCMLVYLWLFVCCYVSACCCCCCVLCLFRLIVVSMLCCVCVPYVSSKKNSAISKANSASYGAILLKNQLKGTTTQTRMTHTETHTHRKTETERRRKSRKEERSDRKEETREHARGCVTADARHKRIQLGTCISPHSLVHVCMCSWYVHVCVCVCVCLRVCGMCARYVV